MVGVFDPELDAVALVQLVPLDLVAVDEQAVETAAVFDETGAALDEDLGVFPRDAAVPQSDFAAGQAADAEGAAVDLVEGFFAGRIHQSKLQGSLLGQSLRAGAETGA